MNLREVVDVAVIISTSEDAAGSLGRVTESIQVQTVCPAQTVIAVHADDSSSEVQTALNMALDKVETSHVAFVRHSDIFLPEHVESLLKLDADLAYSDTIYINESGEELFLDYKVPPGVLARTDTMRYTGGIKDTWSETLTSLIETKMKIVPSNMKTYIMVRSD